MVSRPVVRAEIEPNPKAKEAMLKEWKGLRDQEVFDFSMVREYDDVVAEAKKDKKEVHMARVHGIALKRITNYLKVILVESSKEEVFCWVTK